ncbi:MAG: sugar phosphate nucleotidyltransferase [Anaerolineaceae bacterium]|nr:sugar phosphate nucleotidyltransferase [Anaerolineaceae bacterium]
MTETLKVVIPMAGLGTRLRPHTWSKPKPLVSLAGRSVLDYILDLFKTLPDPENVEFIFIIGYLGEQVKDYMTQNYPHLRTHFVLQEEMLGQSHAIYLARNLLGGPMIMAYADTIIQTDFGFLANERCDAVAWVQAVKDPRRFGVAHVDSTDRVDHLVEKPQDMSNNLAVVGFYYFRDSLALIRAIEEQMQRRVMLQGEYFLADAINILLTNGMSMRTEHVEVWLDAGTPETLLETNRYLLEHGYDNSGEAALRSGVVVVPPVFLHPSARVENSVIGPNVSLGEECEVQYSILRNSIIEGGAQVTDSLLEGSLLGRDVVVNGQPTHLNLGDQSWAMK